MGSCLFVVQFSFCVWVFLFVCGFFVVFSFCILQMFEGINSSDEASASSAKGEKFKADVSTAVVIFFKR